MLLRFPALDREMDELFQELVFQYSHAFDPILSEVPTYSIHEGTQTTMRQGDRTWGDPLREATAEYSLEHKKLKDYAIGDFVEAAKTVGGQFLDDKKRMMFETLNKATTETGNVIDGANKPLDHDHILQALEMIQIDFNAKGEPILPTMVVSPSLAPTVQRLSSESENDAGLKERHQKIIAQKREEFLAREADRKLVG